MQRIVSDPASRDGFAFAIFDRLEPAPDEAVVKVHAFSLNRGEVKNMFVQTPGTLLGWDLAGVVVEPAPDGSGPPTGTSVLGVVPRSGSWSELALVPTSYLAEMAPGVTYAAASTLGIAGLTAVHALRYGDGLLGKVVIVTGAAGGVGRLAVQLAVHGGAEVIAIAGDPNRAETIEALGLDRVSIEIGLRPEGRSADLILESAGGESLSAAMRRVAVGGTVVTLGRSSREPATISPGWFFRNARLQGFSYLTPDQSDRSAASLLAGLCRLVAESKLDPGIGLDVSWQDVGQATRQLLDRKVSGKAVVHIVAE